MNRLLYLFLVAVDAINLIINSWLCYNTLVVFRTCACAVSTYFVVILVYFVCIVSILVYHVGTLFLWNNGEHVTALLVCMIVGTLAFVMASHRFTYDLIENQTTCTCVNTRYEKALILVTRLRLLSIVLVLIIGLFCLALATRNKMFL